MCTTDAQQTWFQQCTNLLLWCIEAWQQAQVFFMPSVSGLQNEWAELTNWPYSPEDVPLFLPLQITGKAVCPHTLEMIKFWLREGQAHDVLNDLCQGLRSHAYMLKFKDRFLHGQGANTRARNCLKALDAKINATTARYHIAYHAVNTLGPLLGQVSWKDKLCPLADEDIRVLSSGFDLQPVSCTKHVWYSEHGTYYQFKFILEWAMSATHVAVILHMGTSPAYEEEFMKMDYPDVRNGYGTS